MDAKRRLDIIADALTTPADDSVAELVRLVCEFCKAVGEPIPVDAIAAAERHRKMLEWIAGRESGIWGVEAHKALHPELHKEKAA